MTISGDEEIPRNFVYILAIVDQTRFLGVSLLHLFILLGNTCGHPNHLVISLQKQMRKPNH